MQKYFKERFDFKMRKSKNMVYTITCVGIMAALCFVGFYYLKIEIPMYSRAFHFGNTFMLVGALLFGGLRGGTAAAIGMSMADIFTANYAIFAPGTFICKFIGGFVCGKIAYGKDRNGEDYAYNATGAAVGGLIQMILSLINVIITNMLAGSSYQVELTNALLSLPMVTFLLITSIVIAVPLAMVINKSLISSGLKNKF